MTTYPDQTQNTIIECSCGTHLLMVQSYVQYFDQSGAVPVDYDQEKLKDGKIHFVQEYNLAMFGRGEYRRKPNLFKRFIIALRYMYSGNMHLDQMVMTQDEATKLATFITDNMVKGEREVTGWKVTQYAPGFDRSNNEQDKPL